MVLLGNAPLFILGWRHLAGRACFAHGVSVAAFSFFTDALTPFFPANGVTNDLCVEYACTAVCSWALAWAGLPRPGYQRRQRHFGAYPQPPRGYLNFTVLLDHRFPGGAFGGVRLWVTRRFTGW